MRKLDFHCHIYPAKIAEKARQSTGGFYGVECGECTGVAEDLLARCDEAGIETCVIHSVATKPEQVDSINRFLLRTAREYPGRFVPFGIVISIWQSFASRNASMICCIRSLQKRSRPGLIPNPLNISGCHRKWCPCTILRPCPLL